MNDCVLQVLTHPLFAAFAREPDVLRAGAVWSGHTDGERAGRHAGHSSASALAVRVAGRLEGLALLVHDAVDLAAKILLTCRGGTHSADAVSTLVATPAAQIDVGNLIRK